LIHKVTALFVYGATTWRKFAHRTKCGVFAQEDIICQSVKMCTVTVVPVCWRPERGERSSNENKSSTIVYVDSNTSILLQTAIAQVSRVHQLHSVVNMRIVFGGGSQIGCLPERENAKLNLLFKRKEKLLINTLGQ